MLLRFLSFFYFQRYDYKLYNFSRLRYQSEKHPVNIDIGFVCTNIRLVCVAHVQQVKPRRVPLQPLYRKLNSRLLVNIQNLSLAILFDIQNSN